MDRRPDWRRPRRRCPGCTTTPGTLVARASRRSCSSSRRPIRTIHSAPRVRGPISSTRRDAGATRRAGGASADAGLCPRVPRLDRQHAPPVEQGGMTVTTRSRGRASRGLALGGADHQVRARAGEAHAMGIADETVVVFTSDHGEFLGNHAQGAAALSRSVPGELRDGGTGCSRGGPDIDAERTSMPTLLELAGRRRRTAGRGSLVPELRGEAPGPRERFLEFHPRMT